MDSVEDREEIVQVTCVITMTRMSRYLGVAEIRRDNPAMQNSVRDAQDLFDNLRLSSAYNDDFESATQTSVDCIVQKVDAASCRRGLESCEAIHDDEQISKLIAYFANAHFQKEAKTGGAQCFFTEAPCIIPPPVRFIRANRRAAS